MQVWIAMANYQLEVVCGLAALLGKYYVKEYRALESWKLAKS